MGFRKSILDLVVNYFADRKLASSILICSYFSEILKFDGLKLLSIAFDERAVDIVRGDDPMELSTSTSCI